MTYAYLAAPDDPSQACIDEPELVARGINGNDTRDIECPLKSRVKQDAAMK
jgi:hypothetical protein